MSPLAMFSITSPAVTLSDDRPPNSSGRSTPIRPSAPISRISSREIEVSFSRAW